MPELMWRKAARKQLLAIRDKSDREAINAAVNELKKFPLQPPNLDVKPLTAGEADYRLRWGNYRVLFDYVKNEEPKIIAIQQVARRTSKTY
ncbi:type II toxin-antitoxin system RelE/ParE family toxin [Erwinia sp. ACCC 02193]|jgi:mRNA interferase RelE/StbE|uniref:Type II toxin-antitoxin system RelE/ParE family toxin n=1 Tax=Erwinia aeris TaxID=3239803 RepID=A0ABV4ECN1_9GAMM